jgi:hypothetical protein
MVVAAILPRPELVGHHGRVDDSDEEATQLMLETLFDVRAMVSDVHGVFFEYEDEDEGEEEEDS